MKVRKTLRRMIMTHCLMVPALLLSACGGHGSGGGNSSGGGNGSDNGDVQGIASNGDIVASAAIFNDLPSEPIDSMYVSVLPPKNPGGPCTDGNGHGRGPGKNSGKSDWSGCTLSDVNHNLHHNGYKPRVRVHFSADDYPDDGLKANAKMRIRGGRSRHYAQKSYRIKLDKHLPSGKWHAERKIQINKHPTDLTRIRNKLAFDLIRRAQDIPSLRTHFVHLFVTDEAHSTDAGHDYGLFTYIARVDKHWPKKRSLKSDSNLFKTYSFKFGPLYSTPELKKDRDSLAFQSVLKSKGKNHDMSVLFSLLNKLNDPKNNFETVFHKYFHPDNFRTWLALNVLLSNQDSVIHNYYLYRPSSIDNFYFVPWDYDGALGAARQYQRDKNPPARFQEGLSNWWFSDLVKRYIKTPGEVQKLTNKIKELHSTRINARAAQSLINHYPMAHIQEIIQNSPDIDHLPIDPNNSESLSQQRRSEVMRLPETIEHAYRQYMDNLERPMPFRESANVTDGVLSLSWSQAYDIQGDALFYDVRLTRSPKQATHSAQCTKQPSEPVPQLSDDVVTQQDGLTQTSFKVQKPLLSGRYYLQVIARDAKGYCQISYSSYEDSTGARFSDVYAFDYDAGSNTVKPAS